MNRNCKQALPTWRQAKSYFEASQSLPPASAPLTLYYGFLNATKSLLIVKGKTLGSYHGVTGSFSSSKRTLAGESITFKEGGVIGALSNYLGEGETRDEHSLKSVLSNFPFIHRAFRHTYTSHPDMFIPLRNLVYRKNVETSYVWLSADVVGRYGDRRSLTTLPSDFEKDEGYKENCVIRTRKKFKWYNNSSSSAEKKRAMENLHRLHQKSRKDLCFISASPHLWYIKRNIAKGDCIKRDTLTLMIAAMHRLSELSRYDPEGLMKHLNSNSAWLLTEFIRLAPNQFIDELVCEMTNFEFALPGIRPLST